FTSIDESERFDALELRLGMLERIDQTDRRRLSPMPYPPPDEQSDRDDCCGDQRPEPPRKYRELEERTRWLRDALRGVRRENRADENTAGERNASFEAVVANDNVGKFDRLRSDVPRGDAIVSVLL